MAEPNINTPLLQPEQNDMGDVAAPRAKRLEDRATLSGGSPCACCFGRAKIELNRGDRDSLWQLRDGPCNEPFDAQSPDTDRLLVEIWNSAFPAEPIVEADTSPRWPRLGFQSSNPRTDVRTGRFALLQLHYFFRTYPEKAQQVVLQSKTTDFPLAICCFNLTHMVIVFFDLYNSQTVSPISGAAQADLWQLKNFASLCNGQAKVVLDELLCVLIEYLNLTWKDMCVKENANLMDFPKAMRKVYDAHAEFWSVPRRDISEFQCMLEPLLDTK